MTIAVDQDPPPKIVGAVVNAISILRYLAQLGEPVGVAVIARNSGVSVSTCFNILRTLTMERLVDFDAAEKTYRIGMGVLMEGTLTRKADGVTITAPAYVLRAPGTPHGPFISTTGCMMLETHYFAERQPGKIFCVEAADGKFPTI